MRNPNVTPEKLAAPVEALREQVAEAKGAPPEVVVLGGLPADPARGADILARYDEAGATQFIAGTGRYDDASEFCRSLDSVVRAIELYRG